MRKINWKKVIVSSFLTVPVLASFISTLHILSLFNLGNTYWISVLLALTFELGSVLAFIVPSVVEKIRYWMVYTIFGILVAMQIIGNIYYSYDFIYYTLKGNPNWLDSFSAFISNFGYFGNQEITLYLSLLIGIPIPLISLFFLKSWVDVFKDKGEFLETIYNKDEPLPSEVLETKLEEESKLVSSPIQVEEDFGAVQNNYL